MSRHSPEMTDLADRMAEIICRHVIDLRFTRLADAAEAAAFRLLADTEIAAGLRALPVLAALAELHRQRRWQNSDVVVCDHCQTGWPCRDRQILDGELAEVSA